MKYLLPCLLIAGCAAPKPPETEEPLMIAIEPSPEMVIEPNPNGEGFIVTRKDGTVEVYDKSNQTQEDIDAAIQRNIDDMYQHAGEDKQTVDDLLEEWK